MENKIQPENDPAIATAPTEAAPVATDEARPAKKRLSSGPFGGEGIPFGSNEMRLSPMQWLITIVLSAAILWMLPKVWNKVEPLKLDANARVPYDLALGDYWQVQRYFNALLKETDNAVVGDSVMWGAYVTPENALPAQLSQRTSPSRFVNLGISGCHPVANYGLIYYYGEALRDKNVLIQFNPLWMSTPREDLTTATLTPINHPKLLPQFVDKMPADNTPKLEDRLSVSLKRNFEIYGWVTHMQNVCFDGSDIPAWTIEHPYSLPTLKTYPDLPEDKDASKAKPWTSKKTVRQVDFPFMALEKSNQWRYFQKMVELLQSRGNKVYVLVGPYNEHMIKGNAVEVYQKQIKPGIESWLKEKKIPYMIPEALPTELYADSSHPMLNGYGLIADKLVADPEFQKIFVKK